MLYYIISLTILAALLIWFVDWILGKTMKVEDKKEGTD
jgi:preprotein translocase subunit SecE